MSLVLGLLPASSEPPESEVSHKWSFSSNGPHNSLFLSSLFLAGRSVAHLDDQPSHHAIIHLKASRRFILVLWARFRQYHCSRLLASCTAIASLHPSGPFSYGSSASCARVAPSELNLLPFLGPYTLHRQSCQMSEQNLKLKFQTNKNEQP
jgi:hypothetical protein